MLSGSGFELYTFAFHHPLLHLALNYQYRASLFHHNWSKNFYLFSIINNQKHFLSFHFSFPHKLLFMTKKRTFRSFSSSHHHKADPIGFLQAFSQYVPALLYSRRHPQSTDYPYLRHLTSACNRHISSYNPHNHLTFPPHHQNFHTFS